MSRVKERRPRAEAAAFTELVQEQMPAGVTWEFGGSWRRVAPEIGDLDVMVITPDGLLSSIRLPPGFTPQRQGDQLLSGILELPSGSSRIQLDMWAARPEQAGAMLMFVTGPARLNIAQREHARKLGLKLSQYGVFTAEGTLVPAAAEAEVYELLGLAWLAPEERQAWAEPSARARPSAPSEESWQVPGSREGAVYLVSRSGSYWSCTCQGFTFCRTAPRTCRHVIAKQQETGWQSDR